MTERSPNITYPYDTFWLADVTGRRWEFSTADAALSFAVHHKDLFRADIT